MTIAEYGYKASNPNYTPRPVTKIRFRLLREGEVTGDVKVLRIFRGWDSAANPDLVFSGTEYTDYRTVDLSVLIAQGDWLAWAFDDAAPRKTRATYLQFVEGGTYTFNISSGDGGAPGTPAILPALVRVDGLPADRQVVVIERPLDGQWRLAGYGPTPEGNGLIDVRVTGGSVYAIALDDWGAVFTADLAVTVGQTIRPSEFNGWLYRITEAGVLPSTEPQWWPVTGDNAARPLGSARALAVRYHRPLAHGPVPIELT